MPEDVLLSQEVKELVRGTRQAVGSNFLGSLESFLVYLESLMEYCKLFLADTAVEAIMKVSSSACGLHASWQGAQETYQHRSPFLYVSGVEHGETANSCSGYCCGSKQS